MAGRLIRLAAWAASTALAVTLSWFAVSDVLAREIPVDRPASALAPARPAGPPASSGEAATDPSPHPSAQPSPLTLPSPSSMTAVAGEPAASETLPGAGIAPGAGTVPPRSPGAVTPSAGAGIPPAPTGPAAQSYQLDGGRVVIETTDVAARLVSAIPDVGWTVQAWQAEGWLRVDFSRDGRTSSCFVTWNGHPPSVQIT
ncbi:hypothetical protein [Parafrankia sp. FMc2]|uniref:hypothetical protein n=1 Tax=Parafrankia sp. FMc2 TaxID=3233196 RepID=UPI0034D7A519